MKSLLVSIPTMFLAGAVYAQSSQFLSTDGSLFDFKTNENGAVLTSIDAQDEPLMVNFDGSVGIDVGDSLYLGRGCDAFSEEFGDGSWNWTNGGFIIEFSDVRVAFPGQSIDLVSGNTCRL